MGNACLVREEDPGADLRHYQACLELEAEVRARLQNTEQLRMECINYYREECIRGDLQLLTKEHWHRRTHDFINRISFNDQRTKERIDIAVDDICSDTGSITEGKFVECMHTALTLALMSLEEKRARYESRYGPMAPGQTPFGGGEAMSSHDESVLMSQSQSHPHEEDWVEKRERELQSQEHLWQPGNMHGMNRHCSQENWHSQQHQQQQQQQQQQNPHMSSEQEREQLLLQMSNDRFIQNSQPALEPTENGYSSQQPQQGLTAQAIHNMLQDRQNQDIERLRHLQQQASAMRLPPALISELEGLKHRVHEQELELEEMRQHATHADDYDGPQKPAFPDPRQPSLNSPRLLPEQARNNSGWSQQDLWPHQGPQKHTGNEENIPGVNGFPVGGGVEPVKDGGMASPMGSDPRMDMPTMKEYEAVKRAILSGEMPVSVYNKHLQLEQKTLAYNDKTRRISLHRTDGLCDDSWHADHLRCITRGIAATVLQDPPPADRGVAFRFHFRDGSDDRFLCLVFNTKEQAFLSTQVFSTLCGVEIVQ